MAATETAGTTSLPGKAPVVVAVILSIFALYLGRYFLIPIALALLLHALLRRPVRALEGWKVPTPLGALIVLAAGLIMLVAAGWALATPVQTWFAKAPVSMAAAQQKLRTLRRPVERLARAAAGDSSAAGDTVGAARKPRAAGPAPAPAASSPGLVTQALGTTALVVGGLAEVVLLLYLLLSSGDMFLRKLLKVIPERADKRTAIDILHFAESVVADYLVFTVVIAAGQGAAVGLAMWALGMPDPLVLGLLTAVLELIPYLGAVVMIGLLSLSALTVFDSLGHAALVPLSYLVISAIQNNIVTPVVFSGRLRLNSVAVLIGVVFWYFVWGIPGAFLAIPIMAMLKALSDDVPNLKPLGEFLSD